MRKSNCICFSLILFVVFSTALGAAWTKKRLTINSGSSVCPAIAVCGSKIYVVWHDATPGNCEIYFKKSADGGATWQTNQRLTNNAGQSVTPDIAVDGSTVYVAWSDNTPGNYDIYFKKSTDGGATWNDAIKLTNNSGDSNDPKIVISGTYTCVVWSDDTPGNNHVYFVRSADSGATWQSAQKLTNDADDSVGPNIAAYGSNLYMVWFDLYSANDDIYFRKSTDSGATWQSEQRLTENGAHSWHPSIAVGGSLSTKLYTVWRNKSSVSDELFFRRSTNSGASWKTQKQISDNAHFPEKPYIAARGANVYVVWNEQKNGVPDIFFMKSDDAGVTWQSSQNISNNAGVSYRPRIAINATNVYVVWDDGSGNHEIYIAYSPL